MCKNENGTSKTCRFVLDKWWWILTENGTDYLHSCRYVPIEVGISRLGRGHMREPLMFALR